MCVCVCNQVLACCGHILCPTPPRHPPPHIIFADGVWDVMSDEAALDIVLQFWAPSDAAGAAKALVQEARRVWETREGSEQVIDDISAVVVFLP